MCCGYESQDLTVVVIFHFFNRAFAVVASALGIPSLLPFLKAVCRSKKSWQARHTGIKIVQQIAILMGCAILPHLRNLVEIIEHGKITVVLKALYMNSEFCKEEQYAMYSQPVTFDR